MSSHAGDGGGGHQREVSWAQFVGEELGAGLRTCPIGDAARRSVRVGDGNRFFLPAISFVTDLFRPGDTLRPRYHGGWLASLRLPPCAGRRQSQDRSELCSTHQSLSRNTVHRYQETPFNLTYVSTALLHHFFTRRAMGDIAPR